MSKEIFLTGKHGSIIGNYAIVDDEDFEKISKYKWYCLKMDERYYPSTTIKGKETLLHRFILNVTDKYIEVDHKNHNTLDATKENLRLATRLQNSHNIRKYKGKLPYKGVFQAPSGKYIAYIKNDNIKYNLGTYNTQKEAALVYDFAAIKYHGEFACLNFPENDYSKIEHPKSIIKSKLGERYISYNIKGYYEVQMKLPNGKIRKRFKDIKDAIEYRNKLLQEINNSNFKHSRG